MILKNLIIPFTLINKRKHNSLKISDYPVFYYKNKSAQQENIKFSARILFWAGMVGHGKNFKEAFRKLCENFDLYKKIMNIYQNHGKEKDWNLHQMRKF